jgi:peptidoglycan/LPS O-acetylase OafA/YrhL
MVEAIAWGVGSGALIVVMVGLRRLPWLYAILVGVGFGLVLGVVRLATLDPTFDPGMLVLLGALGGSVATFGNERGERERVRRSAAILAGRPSSIG